MTIDKDVQGLALYLEFRKPLSTCQILISPDGFDTLGKPVTSVFMRRVLTTGATKRKWRPYVIPSNDQTKELLREGREVTSNEELDELMKFRMRGLGDYLVSIARNGYTLANDSVIYVEVSKEDLGQLSQATMPTKLWTRVKSSRIAKGFPENIIDPLPPVTTPTY